MLIKERKIATTKIDYAILLIKLKKLQIRVFVMMNHHLGFCVTKIQ